MAIHIGIDLEEGEDKTVYWEGAMWQKAIVVNPGENKDTLGKELWTQGPPIHFCGEHRDVMNGRSIHVNRLAYRTNLLSPSKNRVYIKTSIVELQAEFLDHVDCIQFSDWKIGWTKGDEDDDMAES